MWVEIESVQLAVLYFRWRRKPFPVTNTWPEIYVYMVLNSFWHQGRQVVGSSLSHGSATDERHTYLRVSRDLPLRKNPDGTELTNT